MPLSKHEQTWMIGIRNTFYRFAILFGQGILIIVAGKLEIWAGDPVTAWSITFGVLCIMFIVFSVYHWLILPKPLSDQNYSKQNSNQSYTVFSKFYFHSSINLKLVW